MLYMETNVFVQHYPQKQLSYQKNPIKHGNGKEELFAVYQSKDIW